MCQPSSARTRKGRTHCQDALRVLQRRFRCLCYASGLALWFAGRRLWISGERRRPSAQYREQALAYSELPHGAYDETRACRWRRAERSRERASQVSQKRTAGAARPRVCDSPAAPSSDAGDAAEPLVAFVSKSEARAEASPHVVIVRIVATLCEPAVQLADSISDLCSFRAEPTRPREVGKKGEKSFAWARPVDARVDL